MEICHIRSCSRNMASAESSKIEADVLDDDTLDLSDTLTLVSQYVDNLDSDVDKPRLNNLMKSLYIEAQEYDTI